MKRARLATGCTVLVLASSSVVMAGEVPASAAYPGKNGRIAVSQTLEYGGNPSNIWTANRDNTGWKQLTHDGKSTQPSWSPDGTKIATRTPAASKS
jgi:Tol biopolymer transport system component